VRCEPFATDSVELLADGDYTRDPAGGTSPLGISDCPPGKYCPTGLAIECPTGSFCPSQAVSSTRLCPPGTFAPDVESSVCQLCPPGTFCFFHGQDNPYKCKPGYTCHYEGSAVPVQPCPAGSYCPKSIAANFYNSTMQAEYHPNLCYKETYCLWGVYTPTVIEDDPQTAKYCTSGVSCEEGSESPIGKGKC